MSEKKEFRNTSYAELSVHGISNHTQYHKDGDYDHSNNNQINTNHFRVDKCEIDMLLNCDKGTLNLYVVDENNDKINESKEAKLWNIPIKKYKNGWIPHFNVASTNAQLRIAKIPYSMYAKPYKNVDIFAFK